MTLAERRAAVRAALTEDPNRSDRFIAALCECDRSTVRSIRHATTTPPRAGQGPSRAFRVGRDGKRYPEGPNARPHRPACRYLTWIGRLVDRLASPEFAATWRRTSPATRDRLRSAISRLKVVLENLEQPCTALWSDATDRRAG